MAVPTVTPPVRAEHHRRPTIPVAVRSLRPVWSKPAAFRALRATLVVPSLFAITYEVIGNPRMATFAAFGGFATLVLASFGGSRRNKLVAHLPLGATAALLAYVPPA